MILYKMCSIAITADNLNYGKCSNGMSVRTECNFAGKGNESGRRGRHSERAQNECKDTQFDVF